MKGLLLLAAVGAALSGCAGDAAKLKQDHSYVVEWIGERPLMDYAHLTVTLGADMLSPAATPRLIVQGTGGGWVCRRSGRADRRAWLWRLVGAAGSAARATGPGGSGPDGRGRD